MADDTAQSTRVVGLLATLVRWVGLVIALILAIHVLLTIGNANPANWITDFFRTWADPFALGFKDLFLSNPGDDPKLRVLVNYGLAALFWLVGSNILSRLIRRLA
ncbi:MAG TPA: hypothetical protein VGX25_24225 [Actinophytocola sp.]|uniref:hypothetical protein n=1 Tax=Actinophytocola sp. TaxID=1872138 RepID=UPI002DDCEA7A|nr:hypothetical protein [Actinophytocola sp.]HEV2782512.1 hypothetical protein [Actinophytocola sp.]